MSVDLDWEHLNSALAGSLVALLNRQLTNITRPSFIGPVEVTSFDFGTAPPDIEIVDLRNIHPDFLEDEDDDDDGENPTGPGPGEEDEFEWVSRRGMRWRGLHEGYGGGTGTPPAMDMFGSTPGLSPMHSPWSPAMTNLLDLRASYPSMSSPYRTSVYSNHSARSRAPSPPLVPQPEPAPPPTPPPSTSHPNLQAHLHITWASNLRLTLTTSLLINYPSPMFMSLPIKLSVTGLLFDGQLAVAYEGARKRVHLCVMDELDPYGPCAARQASGTPTEVSEEDVPPLARTRSGEKAPPVGLRLLPRIEIESEIGQADKHVLKNVTRVEKFIQDVIRKTVEEELVFPNFHTLVLGDQ